MTRTLAWLPVVTVATLALVAGFMLAAVVDAVGSGR